jgi:hypothetical protein
MSDIAVPGGRIARRGRLGIGSQTGGKAPDARRALQLVLAAVWLLDGVLQYQSFMYSRAFGQMLAATAAGNPGVIAGPITWNAALVEQHGVLLNTVFATTQLLLALGIAFRPATRFALGASIAWAAGVWWFGEGLGGVLTGNASPVNGAPGAVIIYALLAVLLWPAGRDGEPALFIAAGAIGTRAARALWLLLWLSLAYFALLPASRAPQALSGMISGLASGEPGWLAAVDRGAAALVVGQGLAASVALAMALTLIAAGVYLPRLAARAILTGSATDPNSGPLLALLALAYWPARRWTAGSRAPATARGGRHRHRQRAPGGSSCY